MKSILIFLFIFQCSIASSTVCESLFVRNDLIESGSEIIQIILELHRLRVASFSKNRDESRIAAELFSEKLQALGFILSESEIQRRLKEVNILDTESIKQNSKADKAESVARSKIIIFLSEQNFESIHDKDAEGNTLLHRAVESKNHEIIDLLIKEGISPDVQNDRKETPLLTAVRERDAVALNILLDRGANANIKDENFDSPLMYSIKYDREELAKIFIARKVNLNIRDRTRSTPLIEAVTHGKLDLVNLLLENKANVNLVDSRKRTALMWAVSTNSEQLVELLLNAGADKALIDNQGKTALDYELKKSANFTNPSIIKLLK